MTRRLSARPRRRVRPVAGAAAIALLLVAGSVPVVGFSSSVPATILKSTCSSAIAWRGGFNHWNTYQLPHGTVRVCYWKYRLQDQDPAGDYYAIDVTSDWTLHPDTDFPEDPATASQYAISNVNSIDNVYRWTRTFTSSTSCGTPFSVGLNASLFSISTSPEVCRNYTVAVVNPGTRGATWQTGYAGKMQYIETTFVQKVSNGVVPTYSIQFRIPYYIYRYDANYSGYWVTPAWVYKTYTGV